MFLMQFFISIYDIYVYFKIKLFIMKVIKFSMQVLNWYIVTLVSSLFVDINLPQFSNLKKSKYQEYVNSWQWS